VIAQALNTEIKARDNIVRAQCIEESRRLVKEKRAADIKQAFNTELWRQVAHEVMERDVYPYEDKSLMSIFRSIVEVKDGQTIASALRADIVSDSLRLN